MQESADKIERVLGIYTKLMNGGLVYKNEEATNYGVSERTIQRDIDDTRNHLELQGTNEGVSNTVIYERNKKGYRLEQIYNLELTNPEILAICKILLGSRSLPKNDIKILLSKLISCCGPYDSRRMVKELISNEEFHYVELQHKTNFLEKLWNIGTAIKDSRYIEIDYFRVKDKTIVKRKPRPVAIIYSEYYFYFTAFIDDKEIRNDFDVINDSFPTIYRVDRVKELVVCEERFHIPYSSRFEEGEFRKRIQFMYGGKIRYLKFLYKGYDVDSILDRLPTAKIVAENNGVYEIHAEVFGDGIDMRLRSQCDRIELINMHGG